MRLLAKKFIGTRKLTIRTAFGERGIMN